MKDGCLIVGTFLSIMLNTRMSFCKGITQGGSNADTLLTDAYIKGIQYVSWTEAFEAIRKVFSPTKNLTVGRRRRTGQLGFTGSRKYH